MGKATGLCVLSLLLAAIELVLFYFVFSADGEVQRALVAVEGVVPHYLQQFRAFAWLHLAASVLLVVLFALRDRFGSQR